MGGKERHHPWSQEGNVFSSKQVLDHLISVAIPLEKEIDVSDEPPIKLPKPPEIQTLGTNSTLLESITIANQEKIDIFKRDSYAEHDQREEAGEGGCWYEMQCSIMPKVDSSLVGFKIEMLFRYTEPDGTTFLSWCHGQVTMFVNKKTEQYKLHGTMSLCQKGCQVVKSQAYEVKIEPKKHKKWGLERVYDLINT